MKKEYLPIGTVVLLKGGTHEVMINGYCAETPAFPDKTFDYRGCPYPEGIPGDSGVALFNNDMIDKVVYEGLKNDESINFLDKLSDIVERTSKN